MADLLIAVPPDERVRVHDEVAAAHEQLRALLEQCAAPPPPADPRAPVRALDAALALLCEHLAAVEEVLHPAVRRRLPDQRPAVISSAADTRQAQRTLRSVQQQLWGDSRAGSESYEELAQDLRGVLEQHQHHDERLGRLVDQVLDDDRRTALVERLAAAARRAPTRPHPHLPHRGPVAPVARRVAGWWDDVLDVMDVRRVEGRRPGAAPRPVGLWGSYVLGQALPATPGQEEDAAGASARGQREAVTTR